ncbi:proline-rich receptor-like protein kinase PERK10 [Triticum aestivum]|uniref:proline-rich receptor-like protein kinase PERK10 n=1 Tax=Triticum aestivum TaxID=4565 RepID=UPI001D02CD49|nr:proline-rich receptor-like protein kinase PERK10 [Triticum aestivum]
MATKITFFMEWVRKRAIRLIRHRPARLEKKPPVPATHNEPSLPCHLPLPRHLPPPRCRTTTFPHRATAPTFPLGHRPPARLWSALPLARRRPTSSPNCAAGGPSSHRAAVQHSPRARRRPDSSPPRRRPDSSPPRRRPTLSTSQAASSFFSGRLPPSNLLHLALPPCLPVPTPQCRLPVGLRRRSALSVHIHHSSPFNATTRTGSPPSSTAPPLLGVASGALPLFCFPCQSQELLAVFFDAFRPLSPPLPELLSAAQATYWAVQLPAAGAVGHHKIEVAAPWLLLLSPQIFYASKVFVLMAEKRRIFCP